MNTPLRIAQIAPLIERVPPKKYGGTERVVYHLTEGLVARGHDVTLFASGDSITSARLIAPIREGLRLGRREHSPLITTMLMLAQVYGEMVAEFDIIHSHLEYLTFPYAVHASSPTVFTMHGRLDIGDYAAILRRYRHLPLVSISDNQRSPVPDINWVGTIYHGYPPSSFDYNLHPDDYFLYLGRFSEEKRPDQAIMLAIACGVRLKVAAKIDPADREYFLHRIQPLLQHPLIEYVGEVDECRKRELLKNARALLNTIDWPEPFGLVMIEALASGTPVIVRGCGSAPEIITGGKTGFVCHSRMDFIRAIRDIDTISRSRCRQEFLERFSADAMVCSYESLYMNMLPAHRVESMLQPERQREPLRRVLGRPAGAADRS
ncbi:MAG: glycosyl transferase [Pelodictyon luteolum]|uniref:Glycosyl transferase n=1 Tax=Pelodictyon luteolum TaxID=1100 RepID=A0A165M401_PELLU|nr:glycosyltransferase family 4 protein [Pelodictyon luteolum]KZK74784.1 MAG: glycosyl transferase [Pelodictyon luteolum]